MTVSGAFQESVLSAANAWQCVNSKSCGSRPRSFRACRSRRSAAGNGAVSDPGARIVDGLEGGSQRQIRRNIIGVIFDLEKSSVSGSAQNEPLVETRPLAYPRWIVNPLERSGTR